jgi:hypothetical protein
MSEIRRAAFLVAPALQRLLLGASVPSSGDLFLAVIFLPVNPGQLKSIYGDIIVYPIMPINATAYEERTAHPNAIGACFNRNQQKTWLSYNQQNYRKL